MVAIAVLGEAAVNPLATAALKAIKEGPLVTHQSLGTFITDRDHHLPLTHVDLIVPAVTYRENDKVEGLYFNVPGVRAVIQFAGFICQFCQQA